MSFLIKAILGQNVVHPIKTSPTSQPSSDQGSNAPALTDVAVNYQVSPLRGNGDRENKQPSQPLNVTRGYLVSQSNGGAPHSETSAMKSTITTAPSATTVAKPSTPLRTLILRVHTCTIVQDVRDTLCELEVAVGLPYVITTSELLQMVSLLTRYADDATVVRSVLHILVNVTDPMRYPDTIYNGDENGHRGAAGEAAGPWANRRDSTAATSHTEDTTAVVPMRERRRLSESFLQALMPDAVGLLLGQLAASLTQRDESAAQGRLPQQEREEVAQGGASASASVPSPTSSYWTRLYALQLLRRLEEYSPSAVHKLLVDGHGTETVVAMLHDDRHQRALQKECLALLQSLTATDTELQTILAFHNAFDTLFQLVAAVEARVATEGDIALDALATVHNMLRGNSATQKLFREMNTVTKVVPILHSVQRALLLSATHTPGTAKPPSPSSRAQPVDTDTNHADVMLALPHPYAHAVSRSNGHTSAAAASSSSPSSALLSHSTRVPLVHGTRATEVLLTIGILSCLLRDAESAERTGGDLGALQTHCVQHGVLRGLTGVALAGADSIDDGTRIEALRCAAALLRGSRVAVESFLHVDSALRSVAAVQSGSPHSPRAAVRWSPFRALLEELFTSEDATMLEACVQTVRALCTSVSVCQPHVLDVLLCQLGPVTPTATWWSCGEAWMGALFGGGCGAWGKANAGPVLPQGSALPPYAMYYAAHLLHEVLLMPYMAASLLEMRWSSATTPAADTPGELDRDEHHSPNTSTPSPTPTTMTRTSRHVTFFGVYVSFVMEQFGINTRATEEALVSASASADVLRSSHSSADTMGAAAAAPRRAAAWVSSPPCRMGSSVLSAHVRVLLTWLRQARGAARAMAEHPVWVSGLLRCAREEGPAQRRLMSAMVVAAVTVGVAESVVVETNTEAGGVVAAAAAMLNEEKPLQKDREDGKPLMRPQERVDDLIARFVAQLGGPAFFDGILFDLEATTPQWSQPAARAFAAPPLVTFDVALVETMRAVMQDFRALVMARPAAARRRPVAGTAAPDATMPHSDDDRVSELHMPHTAQLAPDKSGVVVEAEEGGVGAAGGGEPLCPTGDDSHGGARRAEGGGRRGACHTGAGGAGRVSDAAGAAGEAAE